MFKRASWLFGFAFIVLIIFLPGYSKLQDLRQKNADFQTKIAQLREENITLQKKLERLEKDPTYLESIAREKMGIARKGEVVYKVNPTEVKK